MKPITNKANVLLLAGLLVATSLVSAQNNNTKSPYTRYGYGLLPDHSFGAQRGMGGIGIGLRNSQSINVLNPASFSAVDSLTFMLDMGVNAQIGEIHDGTMGLTGRRTTGGLDYIAAQFPIARGLGVGVGIMPVSFVGYQYGQNATDEHGTVFGLNTYSGTGGLSKVYASLSYRVLPQLAVGVSGGLLFGDITHSRTNQPNVSGSYITSSVDSIRTKGLALEFGAQYILPLKKGESVVIGAVYTPKTKVITHAASADVKYNSSTGALISQTSNYSTDAWGFQMPETYAVGFSYRKARKWTAGADFQYQRWADTKFYDKTDTLSNRMKINVGAEYIPNVMNKNLLARIRYRAGLSYADSYIIDKNGSRYKEYGASIGFGFPIIDRMTGRSSLINVAFEYSRLQPQSKWSISENYYKLTLSYTFNELWFLQRKLQ